ncbi:MAG: hypothetical protein ACLSFC_25640 [Enterocloster bolteae]
MSGSGLHCPGREGRGFKEWLAENAPGVQVVSELNDEGDVAKSETVCAALFQANPQIKGIFSTHGYGAQERQR